MQRDVWSWHSPALKCTMDVARFGHYGKPLILFSPGGGAFLEHERLLMIKALTPLIDEGRIKVFCVGTVSREGWINGDASPRHKTWLQARFDEYVLNEVLPFVKWESGGTDQ